MINSEFTMPPPPLGWGYPRSGRMGVWQMEVPPPPVWTDTQTENITFPHPSPILSFLEGTLAPGQAQWVPTPAQT